MTKPPSTFEKIKELLDSGWTFSYEPETRFVGANHPHGGRKSICEVGVPSISGFGQHDFGHAISYFLNNIDEMMQKPTPTKPYHCTKCGGAGWAQRSTGEVVECDECDSCGL